MKKIKDLPTDPVEVLTRLREAVKIRAHYVKAETRLGNHIWALQNPGKLNKKRLVTDDGAQIESDNRRRDEPASYTNIVVLGLEAAQAPLHTERAKYERLIEDLAKLLPAYTWVEKTKGLGAMGFGLIVGNAIGETANILDLNAPSKLWKRFGLAVNPDGKPQRRIAGGTDEKTAAAIEQGYSPLRRAIMFTIADSAVRANGPYKAVYDARKVKELEKLPVVLQKTGPKKGERATMHAHKRALRYVAKMILLDLWIAWNPDKARVSPEARG